MGRRFFIFFKVYKTFFKCVSRFVFLSHPFGTDLTDIEHTKIIFCEIATA